MADLKKEIDESLKTLNVVENEGEAPEEETGFNAWDKVQQYLEDGTILSLKIGGIVNKGVIVYVDGLRGFIPASHLEIGYVEDTNPYLGKTVEAKVITADPEKNRLVLSVKEVLYDKKRAEKEARINAIEAGAVLTGKVESLMPYGAFIDLGDDISGLVHISQIAQKRIESPAEVLKVGQEVNVKVLKVENGKISLSMKALEEVAPEEDTNGEETVSYKDEGGATTGFGALLAGLKL
jgi:small subunit ribosomal protein S1